MVHQLIDSASVGASIGVEVESYMVHQLIDGASIGVQVESYIVHLFDR